MFKFGEIFMDGIVIVVLKTETQLICELREVVEGSDEDKKGVCLLLINPYKLKLVENEDTNNLQVRFDKWCPYSIDTQFKVPYDAVMAVGACDPSLQEAYMSKTLVTNNNINEEQINE